MTHECCAETLPLILVDHSESDLGPSRLHDDVTCAARDHGPAAFLHYCDQRDVVDEVDVQEKPDFRLGEVASYSKETTVERDGAAASDGCEEVGPVVRSESADFDRAPIAQRLKCRIVGWFQHHRQLFNEPYRLASNSISILQPHGRCYQLNRQTLPSSGRLYSCRMNRLPICPSQTMSRLPA